MSNQNILLFIFVVYAIFVFVFPIYLLLNFSEAKIDIGVDFIEKNQELPLE